MSLPILSSRFFIKHRPDLGFFSKWQSLMAWNDQLVPIYEWEGILFVGCLQPPKEIPATSNKIVYVLCEHQALKEVWQDLQEQMRKQTPSVPARPATANSDLASAVGMKLKLPNSIPSSIPNSVPNSIPSPTPVSAREEFIPKASKIPDLPSLPELPEIPGLPELPELPDFPEVSAIPDLDLELGLKKAKAAPVAKSEAPTDPEELFPELVKPEGKLLPSAPNAPSGLSLEEEMAAASSEPEASFELSSEEESEKKEEDSLASELDQLLDLTIGTSTKSKVGGIPSVALSPLTPLSASAPASPQASATHSASDESEDTSTLSIANESLPSLKTDEVEFTKSSTSLTSEEKMRRARPTRTEPVRNFKDDVTHISIRALNSTPADTLDELMDQIFQKMTGSFDKSMVLLKTGETMKPWRWDSSFQPASSDSKAVPLATPSPFRIVFRTQKPYHGYVIANDINNEFFGDWNDSHLPEHFTATPILVYDHVIGMLVGFGDKSSDTKEALHLAEELAEQIAEKIKSSPDAMRAA